jgi:2-polyprenyl-3-methyl-5-hydroxy-6-metoxy-1,4-benzoquinol methylase
MRPPPAALVQGPSESHWSAFDAAGIQRLLAAEDRHFWFRARNEIIAALVGSTIRRLPDGFRILEMGCGSGNVLRVLQRLADGRGQVQALELSPEAAKVARARTGLEVASGYLADLSASKRYDLIAAFDVLEHIGDEAGVLRQIDARLKASGRLVLTVPAHSSLWSTFDVASGHVRRYTPASLTRALNAAGFHVEYLSYFMSILFPPMWLRRRLIRSDQGTMAAILDSEFRTLPVVNRVVYEVLRLESHMIRRRRRLPIGTSLAVIAQPVSG